MVYIPTGQTDDTVFPTAHGDDLVTAIRLIEERWNRFYPLLTYTPLNKQPTPATEYKELSGVSGTTKFDTLWGEEVDENLSTWKQPQSDPTINAVDPGVYLDAVPLRGRIKRTVREEQLKKYGFDLLRHLLVTIPTSMLDKAGTEVKAGDRFVWNNERFEVIQFAPWGFYYNTNIFLYIVMNCEHVRYGG